VYLQCIVMRGRNAHTVAVILVYDLFDFNRKLFKLMQSSFSMKADTALLTVVNNNNNNWFIRFSSQ